LLRLGIASGLGDHVHRLEVSQSGSEWLAKLGGKVEARGDGEALDRIAAQLAIGLAKALGQKVSPIEERLLLRDRVPLLVHRLIGQAELDLNGGDPLRARMRFERSTELWKTTVLPEPLDGSWRVQASILARDTKSASDQSELARSALERAEHSARDRDLDRAVTGYQAFLRFTPDRALRWIVPADGARSILIPGQRAWWLSSSEGRVFRIDAISGRSSLQPAAHVVGTVGSDLLELERGVLSRVSEGKKKWSAKLPSTPRLLAHGRLLASSGFAAIAGEDSVAWLDLGVGRFGQTATGIVPLAIGSDGVMISSDRKSVSLLRPGRKTAAWRAEIDPLPRSIAMVRGRVLLVGERSLIILDAQTGKPRVDPISIGIGGRIIGAEGRFAVIAHSEKRFDLFDVLAGAKTAEIEGPAEALAATSVGQGAAVAFASGDVAIFDHDGLLLDRALVSGRPIVAEPALPTAPGFNLLTTRGLYAFGEPAAPDRKRDADAALDLAEILSKRGDAEGALRLAEHVARRSAARIADAEALRARLLEARKDADSIASAKTARARSDAARDLKTALPPFALIR
jgi:hypothetical protein